MPSPVPKARMYSLVLLTLMLLVPLVCRIVPEPFVKVIVRSAVGVSRSMPVSRTSELRLREPAIVTSAVGRALIVAVHEASAVFVDASAAIPLAPWVARLYVLPLRCTAPCSTELVNVGAVVKMNRLRVSTPRPAPENRPVPPFERAHDAAVTADVCPVAACDRFARNPPPASNSAPIVSA